MAKQAAAVPQAIKRRVDAAQLPASVIDDLRELFERYQGDCEFVLEMHTRTGLRRLKFGEAYKVKARDAGFKAELDVLLAPPHQSPRRGPLKNPGTPAAAHPRRLAPPTMLTCQLARHALSRAARGIHGCTTSVGPIILQRTPNRAASPRERRS